MAVERVCILFSVATTLAAQKLVFLSAMIFGAHKLVLYTALEMFHHTNIT
jgi:hypothetical protein